MLAETIHKDRRGRMTFHHLTGGDLVGKAGIKQLDLCHGRLCWWDSWLFAN